MVRIATIPIDKLSDKPFKYEWIGDSGTGKGEIKDLVLGIQGMYMSDKVEVLQGVTASYSVDEQAIIRQYSSKEKIAILNKQTKMNSHKPQRKRGYRILATVPQNLAKKSVKIIFPDNTTVPLQKSQYNSTKYTLISEKAIKVQSIQIQSQQVQRIQQLQQKNFTRRFLINRNPKLICYLTEQPYALANCNIQQLSLKFYLHELFSPELTKQAHQKIVHLKSNKNDEILTRQFGLLVKHGHQQKLIRKINEEGSYIGENQPICQFGYEPLVDQLQIFLYIHHVGNSGLEGDDFEVKRLENWTKLFPIGYGKIILQKLGENNLAGCFINPMQNMNQTLDKHLNRIFVQPQLFCLGSVQMEKKKWGYIIVELLQMTRLQLQFGNESSFITVKMSTEVDGKALGDGIITEARKFEGVDVLEFSNRSYRFFYMEGKDSCVKLIGTLLTINSSYKLFEKCIDIG